MVRLNELISKISEAKTFYSPYGERDAKSAFYTSKGLFRPSNDAVERYMTNLSWGIGPEGRGSRRSSDVTNRSTIKDIATTISSLVQSGRISPRRNDKDLLQRKTRITEEKLRVFDFDDTVTKSKSRVTIRNKKTGKSRKITPAQFAKYKPKSHEETDFSEFDHVIKPKRVKEIHSILKNLAKKKRSFMILTARGNKAKKPIKQYLEREGLYHPERVRITTVSSSKPESKSKVIAKHLNTGKYSHVEFFDDSKPNVEAVSSLKDKYPHIRIRSRHIHYAEKIK
jgi:hypothetical protein